jgi:hypothetical protein
LAGQSTTLWNVAGVAAAASFVASFEQRLETSSMQRSKE